MRIIILEDERLIAESLRAKLESEGEHIQVVAILSGIQEALDYFQNNPLPDLFFSDIRLTDGLSFTFFKQLNANVPVVFCSAYDEYALDAFQQNGIDYIVKPFKREDVHRVVQKIESVKSVPIQSSIDLLETSLKQQDQQLLGYKGSKIVPVKIEDIGLFHLEHKQLYVYLINGEKYRLDQSLKEIDDYLNNQFFKANRQQIISKSFVGSIHNLPLRKLNIHCKDENAPEIIIGKTKATSFVRWLKDT